MRKSKNKEPKSIEFLPGELDDDVKPKSLEEQLVKKDSKIASLQDEIKTLKGELVKKDAEITRMKRILNL